MPVLVVELLEGGEGEEGEDSGGERREEHLGRAGEGVAGGFALPTR